MGTSTSSAGAGSGSFFDPPWLDDAEGSIDSGIMPMPNPYRPVLHRRIPLARQATVTYFCSALKYSTCASALGAAPVLDQQHLAVVGCGGCGLWRQARCFLGRQP